MRLDPASLPPRPAIGPACSAIAPASMHSTAQAADQAPSPDPQPGRFPGFRRLTSMTHRASPFACAGTCADHMLSLPPEASAPSAISDLIIHLESAEPVRLPATLLPFCAEQAGILHTAGLLLSDVPYSHPVGRSPGKPTMKFIDSNHFVGSRDKSYLLP